MFLSTQMQVFQQNLEAHNSKTKGFPRIFTQLKVFLENFLWMSKFKLKNHVSGNTEALPSSSQALRISHMTGKRLNYCGGLAPHLVAVIFIWVTP